MATNQNSNNKSEDTVKKTAAKKTTAASKTATGTRTSAASKTTAGSKNTAAKSSSSTKTAATKSSASVKSTASKTGTASKIGTATKAVAAKKTAAKTTASKASSAEKASSTAAKTASASKKAAAPSAKASSATKSTTTARASATKATATKAAVAKSTKAAAKTLKPEAQDDFQWTQIKETATQQETPVAEEKLPVQEEKTAAVQSPNEYETDNLTEETTKENPASLSDSEKTTVTPDPDYNNVQEQLWNVNKQVAKSNRNLIIGIAAIGFIAVFAILFLILQKSCSSNSSSEKIETSTSAVSTENTGFVQEQAAPVPVQVTVETEKTDLSANRENQLIIARRLMDSGYYSQASAILLELSAQDPSDEEVWNLAQTALSLQAEKEQNLMASQGSGADAASMESLINSLDQSNRQNQENFQAMAQSLQDSVRQNEAIAAQEQQSASELAAQRKIQEEQAAKERAEREAIEAEKAARDAAFKAKNDSINEYISAGKAALASGDYQGAIAQFNQAKALLEESDSNFTGGSLKASDPSYAASKYSEISRELYDASQKSGVDATSKTAMENSASSYAGSAIAQDATNPAAHYVLGMEAINTKDYATAEVELRKAIQKDNTNSTYYYQLGRAQANLKKYAEAATSFSSSSRYDPNFAPAQYNLGYVQERLGKTTEALAAYRKAASIDTSYENAFLASARILQKQKQHESAITDFNKAINVNPTNGKTYKEIASSYYSLGRYTDAESSYIKALAYLPGENDPILYYNLANSQFNLKKYEAALPNAQKAYEFRNSVSDMATKVNIIYTLALISRSNRRDEDAIRYYMEALGLDSTHEKANLNLAVIYLDDIKDPDNALIFLNRAFAKNPNGFEVNNNLGRAYLLKEDYSNAEIYFSKAHTIDKNDIEVSKNLARTYTQEGNYASAKVIYQEILTKDKSNWEIYLEAAKVCIQLGENSLAEGYLITIQDGNPNYEKYQVQQLLNTVRN